MRLKLVLAAASAALFISLLGASGAVAATEIGSNCTGTRAEPPGSTLVQLSSADPASLAAPHDGVLTRWKVNVIPYPGGISEKVKVLRPVPGIPNTFTAVGESTLQPILGGANSFETRIPVLAGDRIGAFSPISTIWCMATGSPMNVMGEVAEDVAIGASATFPPATEPEAQESLVAMSAVVEPDVDRDGFGDETQDKCPQNAAVQVPCPIVSLSSSASVRKTLATVLVTSNLQAPVTVAGTVNQGKGKTAKLNGGTQIVTPGAFAKFTVLFPQKLKAKLKQLSRKRFLWLNLTSTTPNAVGPPTVSKLKLKLKGQAKPKAKPKRQAKD